MAYILKRCGVMIGERIGNYEIVGTLGRGGMGSVYLARHTLIDRQVAIKVLRPELGGRQDLATRFFNEARAATAIKTASIVEIYDFGYYDGRAYLVMEYLRGESLGDRLHRYGHLSESVAVTVARKIARALDAAHAAGIVHRDLKPDNIFLVPDSAVHGGERVKLLDFGIAKLLGDGSPSAVKTCAGVLIGTPAYMSPEQCEGQGEVDHRSDLYALGCILFQMLCGRPPFVAGGAAQVLGQHLVGAIPSPRALAPAISLELDAMVRTLLSKDPAWRYQSAGEVVARLEELAPYSPRLAAGSGVHARPPRDSLPPRGPSGEHCAVNPQPERRRGWLVGLTSLFTSSR